MAITTWVADGSLANVLTCAEQLGCYRRDSEICRFQETLVRLGMNPDEAIEYWNAIDAKVCQLWRSASCCDVNTDSAIAAKAGVLLDTAVFPRNLLLYRIVELMVPGVITVAIGEVAYKGKQIPGRWEYVDRGSKKILLLKFVHQQQIPKKKRRRRPRSSYVERMADRW